MNYHLTPLAAADVEAIGDYIAAHNPVAAVVLLQGFVRRWELLGTQPYSGPARDDLAAGIRRLVIGDYLTLYRVSADTVEILRVLHGKRNITAEDVTPRTG